MAAESRLKRYLLWTSNAGRNLTVGAPCSTALLYICVLGRDSTHRQHGAEVASRQVHGERFSNTVLTLPQWGVTTTGAASEWSESCTSRTYRAGFDEKICSSTWHRKFARNSTTIAIWSKALTNAFSIRNSLHQVLSVKGCQMTLIVYACKMSQKHHCNLQLQFEIIVHCDLVYSILSSLLESSSKGSFSESLPLLPLYKQ